MAYLDLKEGRSALLERTTKAAFIVFILSGLPDMIFGSWGTLWYLVPGLPVCIIAYLLNRRGRGVLAGNVFAFGISLVIFFSAITLSSKSNAYLFYLPFVIGLPFLIDFRNKKLLLIHVSHITLFWLLLTFYDNSYYIVGDMPPSQLKIIGQVNMVLSVFFCQFFVFQIVNASRKAESAIVISEQQLRAQNENLKKGNQELDKFIYSVSHDLRSPVASILGLTNLGKQEENMAEMQEYTHLMKRSLLRMDSYILDILDYSRNTRLAVKQEEINLKEEIKSIVEGCCQREDNTAARVLIEVESKMKDAFYTDRYRLRIVLAKIISNAFYYHKPDRDPQIQISCHVLPLHVIIRIKDNGIGIASEDLEKIFTMFYRSNVTKPGSGLGLYIARETAGRIGGRISATSQEGVGSEFMISIPNLGRPLVA
ncbi:ATP-binding protein [Xanthocytophaga agilis]|uniref:histidine kinase n=1 Tax=Xanthocytophaga agilis TaxID=3048010 RepID=A0AAE3RA22_9BACT|nr:ATP-binding protein [Xanthocytophaga agilis]MDJ1505985.1 ATP-binding protein [Xanthocytophaga agilis]